MSKQEKLIQSIEDGDFKTFKLLIKDSEINPLENDNYAIRLASYKGFLDFVKLLLNDIRVNPSANKNESLLLAAKYGHIEVVKLLLNDSRVSPLDFKHTAIYTAFQNRELEVVKLLWKDNVVKNSLRENDYELYEFLMTEYSKDKIINF